MFTDSTSQLFLSYVGTIVVIIKDIKQSREVLPRIKSTIRPLSQPVEDMVPLRYYRNMRRTVRGKCHYVQYSPRSYVYSSDLEKCYGRHKVTRVDFLYKWLEHNVNRLKGKNYEDHSEALNQKRCDLQMTVRHQSYLPSINMGAVSL